MAIAGGASIKAAVEINLIDEVVAMNIYYFKADFQEEQSDGDVVSAVQTWVEDLYESINSEVVTDITMGVTTVYVYNSITDQWDNHGVCNPSVSFNGAGSMLPHGVAAMVRMYSTHARSTARKYIPGFDEASCTDGTWDAGALTELGSFLTLWRSTEQVSVNNVLIPAVWSTVSSQTYERGTGGVVLAQPAYQRRRRPGVGM